MALRQLVEADCGAANPLMRLGSHFSRDQALQDEGLGASRANARHGGAPEQMVNEFLGRVNTTPQSFRMDALLKEMRDIDAHQFHANLARAPPVIDEVVQHQSADWIREFPQLQQQPAQTDALPANSHQPMLHPWEIGAHAPQPPPALMGAGPFCSRDFFDAKFGPPQQIPPAAEAVLQTQHDHFARTEFSRYLTGLRDQSALYAQPSPGTMLAREFFDKQLEPLEGAAAAATDETIESSDRNAADWAKDFEAGKQEEFERNQNYTSQFFENLQSDWKKLSNDDATAHPWLSDLTDYYNPYNEYSFEANNPMLDLPDALQRGKQFLAQGDLPSSILCFESAVKQEPNNAEIWALLGQSQAENEKDPNAIAALKKSLDLQADNRQVMMALAISYTNESLKTSALNLMVKWLHSSEQYRDLVPAQLLEQQSDEGSLLGAPHLTDVQNVFLQAVHRTHPAVDASIQSALGVLFNMSSEYDKAADCFRATVQMEPQNAKAWNRLGATLANGNRAVEAVEAYQEALRLEPGYIRARYNVGVACVNLKAYREAAEHFLTALNHQATSIRRSGITPSTDGATGGGSDTQMSDTIWGTMHMVVSLMSRSDLQPALVKRDLNALNAEFFGAGEARSD